MKKVTLSQNISGETYLVSPKSFILTRAALLVDLISYLFIVIFLYTAISKYLEFPTFKFQLEQSRLLKPFAGLIAWFIPATEIVLSIGLFLDRFRKISLQVSVTLMILFTIYISGLMLFSPELPCSCGGIVSALSWPAHLVLNIMFIILGFWAIHLQRRLSSRGL